MKNPFKKQGIIDTVINVGVGGAANVAMDYIKDNYLNEMLPDGFSETAYNATKIAIGALGGSMVRNKYAHAALDGVATVGASNLIRGLISGDDDSKTEKTSGLPDGTIGSLRMGQRGFARRARSVRGVGGADFMEC